MPRTKDKMQSTVFQNFKHKSRHFNLPNARPKKICNRSVIPSMNLRMTSRLPRRKHAEVLPTLHDLKTNLPMPNMRLKLLRELEPRLISKPRISKPDLKRSKLLVAKH
jgi:hypothetical protein